MKPRGVVVSKNGIVWSRGLPESCVTMDFERSSVFIRSQITR